MTATKERFLNLCKENIKRQGIDNLLAYLEQTDFFVAPCSTKFHLNIRGGLCEHSLNVYDCLTNLCINFGINVVDNIETITIISLFHDLCKANYYQQSVQNVKENGQWVQKPCFTINDQLPLGHGEKSVILLEQFINLNIDEMLAIRWHMCGFDNAVRGGDYGMNAANKMSIFVTLLQCADMIASNIIEK